MERGGWPTWLSWVGAILLGVIAPLLALPALIAVVFTLLTNRWLWWAGRRRPAGHANLLPSEVAAAFILIPFQGLIAGIGGNWAFYELGAGNAFLGIVVLVMVVTWSVSILVGVALGLRRHYRGDVDPFEPGVDVARALASVDRDLARPQPGVLPSRAAAAAAWAASINKPGPALLSAAPTLRQAAAGVRRHSDRTERAQVAAMCFTAAVSTSALLGAIITLSPASDQLARAGTTAIVTTAIAVAAIALCIAALTWGTCLIWRIDSMQELAQERHQLHARRRLLVSKTGGSLSRARSGSLSRGSRRTPQRTRHLARGQLRA